MSRTESNAELGRAALKVTAAETMATLCASVLWVTGCEGPGVFEDLAKEFVREPEEGYESEGSMLEVGEFSDLGFEPAPPSYDYVLARDDEGRLLIRSLSADEGCRIPDVVGYQPTVWDSLELGEARLPVIVMEDDEPVLRFSDFECGLSDIGLPGGRVVDPIPQRGLLGVKVETAFGNIELASPWLSSTTPFGVRVLPEEHPLAYNLLVFDGRLTLYDALGGVVFAVGDDVVEAAVIPLANEVIFRERSGELRVARVTEERVRVSGVATDACSVLASGSVGAFWSPCVERRLVVYDAQSERLHALSEDAAAPRIVSRSLSALRDVDAEALSAVFFRDFDDASGRGTLWAQRADGTAYELGGDVLDVWMLPLFDKSSEQRPVVALALAEQEGTDTGANLVALNGDDAVPLVESVVALWEQNSTLLVLGDADGASATLFTLETETASGETRSEPEVLTRSALVGQDVRRRGLLRDVLVEAVPRLDSGPTTRSLFRGDASNDHALYLLAQERLPGTYSEPEMLTTDAAFGARFSLIDFDSVLIFTGGNPRSGHTLKQRWYEREFERVIANYVTEFFEATLEGREGLIYATRGETPALWFSKLR